MPYCTLAALTPTCELTNCQKSETESEPYASIAK